jgi:hypothetical protein
MLAFNNKFLGHHPLEHNVLFSGSDTAKLYAENLKLQPEDWYYRTNTISYIRNKNGHRCKDIEDIDLNNYILFAGCSHSEGIGLELEKTYPYLISKSLGCDYYNLGVGGTGVDVLAYNLITWFFTVKQLPKLVVIHWPNCLRFILKSTNQTEQNIYNTYGLWSTDLGVDKFLVKGNDIGYFDTKRTMLHNLIKNVINCPIIEIAYPNAAFNDESVKLIKPIDFSRDLVHSGIFSNLKYRSLIIEIIRHKYKHEFNNN